MSVAYTRADLERLWVSAGGSAADAETMAAIALAESKGVATAHNPSGASGLWQIMLPENASYVPGGPKNVYSPAANARAAVAILAKQGLTAWETYTNGAYRQYLAKPGEHVITIAGIKQYNPFEGVPGLGPATKELMHLVFGGQPAKGGAPAAAKETIKEATGAASGALLSGAGKLVLTAILLLAGAYLVVYGVTVILRPREGALRPPNPAKALSGIGFGGGGGGGASEAAETAAVAA